ncbi:ABC transporter permease [Chlamydia muridarum str. Nigg]|nr:FtsX-like permease family protein [Chlamydia muridarum]UFT29179.1 ABC transporter permease [Chlamydia trachomatis]AHH22813.1 ABC transporter permease [Chlamydia muridarum str. Nigg3 CMUT3-5]AHH23738.1 ABC transporter permease [Chlamydia muridarum str. Nigg CM972]AID37952.1 ABC transporter permease [Chlamydia muridarum str. Nigg 2 MCR]AIT91093.1 ABC transporter permease [Chlamydia muridarum]
MKLELLLAFKYLIPRRKSFSSSIVSVFSVGIVALVVWLSVVFMSVIHGLQQRWVGDLARLHASIRIEPSDKYYESYYYQIDSHAEASQYIYKTIGEKLLSDQTDPYDPDVDFALPETFPAPEFSVSGKIVDPVHIANEKMLSFLPSRKGSFVEFEEGMGYVHMDRASQSSRIEPRSLSQYIAYSSEAFYQQRVLPFEETDYSTEVLNRFNASSEGWLADFLLLQEKFRGVSVILPVHYRDLGYRVGDTASLSIFSVKKEGEVRFPLRVIGFYNPGVSPFGGKTIFIDKDLVASIRSESEGLGMHNGWQVFLPDIKEISVVKRTLQKLLQEADVSSYWEVSSLYDYEFFKPILDQLQSDQVLFSIVSFIVLIVACSNIVTMSILLVNNKKREIGILKAMGVSSSRLRLVFGVCGACSGMLGALLGSILAALTLKNLGVLTHWLSVLQGREAFNPSFFGEQLPQDFHLPTVICLSLGAFVLAAISGALPAQHVARMQVSDILKAE